MSEREVAPPMASRSDAGIDYQVVSSTLKSKLGLRYSPVGVSLAADSRHCVSPLAKKTAFCGMLAKAARGESFYAEIEHHACIGALYYLGLEELPDYPARKRGLYFERRTLEAAIRTRTSSPRLPLGVASLLTCFPLEAEPVPPDVVVIIADALQGMRLLAAATYDTGELVSGLTGTGSCSSIVAFPYLSGQVNYCLSDSGARGHMRLERDELLIGIPAQKIESVFYAIESMKAGL